MPTYPNQSAQGLPLDLQPQFISPGNTDIWATLAPQIGLGAYAPMGAFLGGGNRPASAAEVAGGYSGPGYTGETGLGIAPKRGPSGNPLLDSYMEIINARDTGSQAGWGTPLAQNRPSAPPSWDTTKTLRPGLPGFGTAASGQGVAASGQATDTGTTPTGPQQPVGTDNETIRRNFAFLIPIITGLISAFGGAAAGKLFNRGQGGQGDFGDLGLGGGLGNIFGQMAGNYGQFFTPQNLAQMFNPQRGALAGAQGYFGSPGVIPQGQDYANNIFGPYGNINAMINAAVNQGQTGVLGQLPQALNYLLQNGLAGQQVLARDQAFQNILGGSNQLLGIPQNDMSINQRPYLLPPNLFQSQLPTGFNFTPFPNPEDQQKLTAPAPGGGGGGAGGGKTTEEEDRQRRIYLSSTIPGWNTLGGQQQQYFGGWPFGQGNLGTDTTTIREPRTPGRQGTWENLPPNLYGSAGQPGGPEQTNPFMGGYGGGYGAQQALLQNIRQGLPNQLAVQNAFGNQLGLGQNQQNVAANLANTLGSITGNARNLYPPPPIQGQVENQLNAMMRAGGLSPDYVSAMRNLVLAPQMEDLQGRLNAQGGGVAALNSPLFQELQRRTERDFSGQLIGQGMENFQRTLGQGIGLGAQQFGQPLQAGGQLFGQGLQQAQLQGQQGQEGLQNALQMFGTVPQNVLPFIQTAGNLGLNLQNAALNRFNVLGSQGLNMLNTIGGLGQISPDLLLRGAGQGLGVQNAISGLTQGNVGQLLNFLQQQGGLGLGQADIGASLIRALLSGQQQENIARMMANRQLTGGLIGAGVNILPWLINRFWPAGNPGTTAPQIDTGSP